MMEAAAVIGRGGVVLYWHAPADRTAVTLPDSRRLWEVLWTHRDRVAGVAHTHPGAGTPMPSWEDLTTFAACEDGLGRRLSWWIATRAHARRFRWSGPGRHDYAPGILGPTPWLGDLRAISGVDD